MSGNFIREFYKKKRWKWCLLILVTVIVGLVAPLKSFILQWLIDSETKEQAIYDLGIGLIIILITFITETMSRNIFSKLQCEAVEYIRNRCMNKILNRSMEQYKRSGKAVDLSVLSNDMKLLSDDYYGAVYQILLYGSMLLFALFMYIYINPALLIFVFIAAIAPLILPRLFDSKLKNSRREYSDKLEKYTGNSTEILNGFEVIYDFNAKKGFQSGNVKAVAACAESEYTFLKVFNYSITLSSFLSNVLFFVVLLIGMMLVFNQKISLGYMVAATNLSNFIIAPCQVISQNYARIKASRKIREKIEELLKEEEIEEQKEEVEYPIKTVQVDNVEFQYEENRKILQHANLVCNSGEKIALIGKSGSGKSTLAKIVYGYLTNYQGKLYFNNKDAKKIDLQKLQERIGYASQNSYVFHDTIRNNICLYVEYPDRELQQILEIVGLTKIINNLENGMDTVIDENIKNFSGGELQRIILARILIKRYDMLILDEVTSNLDPETTEKVMQYILQLESAAIVITHDTYGEYMKKFDRIYQVCDGKVEMERGQNV